MHADATSLLLQEELIIITICMKLQLKIPLMKNTLAYGLSARIHMMDTPPQMQQLSLMFVLRKETIVETTYKESTMDNVNLMKIQIQP
jgi:hypothetical protein